MTELTEQPATQAEEMSALVDWLDANIPAGLADLTDWYARSALLVRSQQPSYLAAMQSPAYKLWEQRLVGAGLVCAKWPSEFGGRGWDATMLSVFERELFIRNVPKVARGISELLVGPALLHHGTQEQKERFLPRIVSGQDFYCQAFSEPGSGSDLASLRTKAVVDGDELRINGHKVWSSNAGIANRILLLARSSSSEKPQGGLTLVLLDVDQPGAIEVQPIRQLTGAAEFAEINFQDARASLGDVVGGVGNGWRVAMTVLGYERGGEATFQSLALMREFEALSRMPGQSAGQLTEAYQEICAMRAHALRLAEEMARHGRPGSASSTWKLLWSEYHQLVGQLAMSALAEDGLVLSSQTEYLPGVWQEVFLSSRADTIFSGSSEIQRNIIGERALGLPRS